MAEPTPVSSEPQQVPTVPMSPEGGFTISTVAPIGSGVETPPAPPPPPPLPPTTAAPATEFTGTKQNVGPLLTYEVSSKIAQLKQIASAMERTKCHDLSRIEHVEGADAEGIPPMLMEKGSHDVTLAIPNDSSLSKLLAESISGIGASVAKLLQDLVDAVEEQTMLVFVEHQAKLKEIVIEETLVKKHRWPEEVPPHSASIPATPSINSPKPSQKKNGEASTNVLGTTLHSLLESLVCKSEAEKGLLYIKDTEANMLRCVSQVPASSEAADISLSTTSLPVTVLQTGVAVHTAMGSAPIKGVKARHLLAFPIPGNAPEKKGEKGEAKGGTTLCRGSGAIGVVVLQKHRKVATAFRSCDEWLAAAAALFYSVFFLWHPLQAVLAKYEPLQRKKPHPDNGGERTTASEVTTVEDLLSNSRYAADGVGDQLIIRHPGKETSKQMAGQDAQSTSNSAATASSMDAQLKESVTYIHNLELMWRNCLDEKRALQTDVERYQTELSERQVQLASMEANVKDLSKQYMKAKHDMQRVNRSQAEKRVSVSGGGASASLPPLTGTSRKSISQESNPSKRASVKGFQPKPPQGKTSIVRK